MRNGKKGKAWMKDEALINIGRKYEGKEGPLYAVPLL
jgi:hypothetical protein